ncbi:MAG: hypothetical protein K5894_08400 [Lachnospiraceae bacterium]|nr:hypothetical protein [Lachnospiraceae bacterium]
MESEKKDSKGNVKADVLKHVEEKKVRWREPEPVFEGYISSEALTLISLAAIVIVTIVCAVLHVQMNTVSLPVLLITLIIVILMGLFLGNSPSWITMLLVAAIMIAGAATGMYAEVTIGVVVFLATVFAIKERNQRF